jgi:hypothetical protein
MSPFSYYCSLIIPEREEIKSETRAGEVAQVVASLPSKHKALSSNSSTANNNNNKNNNNNNILHEPHF